VFELKPKTFGELLQAAMQIWGASWRKLFLTVFVLLVPFELGSAALLNWLAPDLTKTLDTWSKAFAKDPNVRPRFSLSEYGAIAGSFGITLLSGVLLVALITPLAANAFLRRNTSRAELLKNTRKRGPVMLLSFFLGLVFSSLPVTAALVGLHFAELQGDTKDWAPTVLLAAGVLSIWLFIRTLSAGSAIVLEGMSATGALSRSLRLTSGRTWRILASRLSVAFLTLIPALAISGMVTSVLTSAGGKNPSFAFVWLAIGGAVAGAIITPISSIFSALLYLDLRVRKEALTAESLATSYDPATGGPPAQAALLR
jgi:Membrane domain of glycerophosphoryl diester phosphodiesterase